MPVSETHSSTYALPDDVLVTEVGGTLLPGLVDCHVHLVSSGAFPGTPGSLEWAGSAGPAEVDLIRQSATMAGRAVHLTAKEFAMLRLLAETPGAPVSRERFLDVVWGVGAFPTTRTVDTHIASLRAKLEPDPDTPRHLNEYVSLDVEMGFVDDHRSVMALLTEVLRGMLEGATEAGDALDRLGLTLPMVPDEIPAIDFFEDLGVPFVVAVNCFDGLVLHAADDVREAVAVDASVPVELFDARDRNSVKHVLAVLVEHSLGMARADLVAATSGPK